MEKRTKKHPVLGTLESSALGGWDGKVTMSRFGRGKWSRRLKVSIAEFRPESEQRALQMASALVQRSSQLTELVLEGLWRELTGNEPQSTTWWGDGTGLQTANEALDQPLKHRDDLLDVLRPWALFVRCDTHGDGELTAGITFTCRFEREHGLDVLTDGTQVLGTGYHLDAEKYERFWTITREEWNRRAKAAMAKFEAARAAAGKRQSS